jgi:hypothetical protein
LTIIEKQVEAVVGRYSISFSTWELKFKNPKFTKTIFSGGNDCEAYGASSD